MTAISSKPDTNQDFEFIFSRRFDAPRNLVWKAWTDNAQLKQWFGPKGCPIITCSLDLRAGGIFHYGMKMPDGGEMWGKWTFLEVDEPEKLIFIASFSDIGGKNVTRHPWNANWPLEMLSTVTLASKGEQTDVTLSWQAYNATAIERATFAEGKDSMEQGWSGTFEQLGDFLGRSK